MMPMAPTSVMTMPISKPKIGFSIDSIVGNRNSMKSPNSESSETPLSPLSDYSYPHDFHNHQMAPKIPAEIQRALRLPEDCTPLELQQRINKLNNNNNNNNNNKISSPPPQQQPQQQQQHHQSRTNDSHRNIHGLPESPPRSEHDGRNISAAQNRLSPDARGTSQTPSPDPHNQEQRQQQFQQSKGPIIVPGLPANLVRPYPVGPPQQHPPPNGMDMKQLPPYFNPSDMVAAAHNQHFLAAQFQAAAAIAQAQQGFQHGGAGLPSYPAHFNNPNVQRDSYQLYPWLLSRHGRIFPHRFPGNFLLQPFRKPKRVRTAFSPTQLLKLEHAFEGNHYVVGAERKTLAQQLSLSETQVKVWFQNRRTKHKRFQQDEDEKGGCGGGGGSGNRSNSNYEEEEDDELIDMDDCSSEEENENS